MTFHIKELRKSMGLSQLALSKKSGVSRGYISNLENGKQMDVKVSTLRRIAEALDCEVTNLFR